MAKVKVANVSDVPEGSATTVDVSGVTVALFHRPDGWCAIEHTCPHSGGPLAEGDVEDHVVTCPWHGSQFDIRSGDLIMGPAERPVRAFQVAIEGEDVTLELS